MKEIKFIDLFSGAGGFSVGFEQVNGFKCVGAIEKTKIYADTHRLNHSDSNTICGDIREVDPGVFEDELDLIIGSPPCQSFSTIGHAKIRSLDKSKRDEYNFADYLYKDFFRFVEFHQPKVFVLENVQQFFTKKSGKILDSILKISKKLGYSCSYEVLNAVNYGVPQNRKRAIIIGSRDGEIGLPEGKFGASQPFRTVKEALSDLPLIHDDWRIDEVEYSKPTEFQYQRLLRGRKKIVSNNRCRVSNERAKKVFAHMSQGDIYMDLPKEVRRILPFREDIFKDRLKRLINDQPSWAVIAHIGMDGYMYIHPEEDRTLSVREAARLQSFPDKFHFLGNMREAYIQVGNAVPPIFAKEIAIHVSEYLQ